VQKRSLDAVQPYLENGPGPGRVRRILSTVLMPGS
jgi:hypothetical protein